VEPIKKGAEQEGKNISNQIISGKIRMVEAKTRVPQGQENLMPTFTDEPNISHVKKSTKKYGKFTKYNCCS